MTSFNVPDMTCDGCARAITKAILAVDPAAHLVFDLPAHHLNIHSAIAGPALRDAIVDAGFSPALV